MSAVRFAKRKKWKRINTKMKLTYPPVFATNLVMKYVFASAILDENINSLYFSFLTHVNAFDKSLRKFGVRCLRLMYYDAR